MHAHSGPLHLYTCVHIPDLQFLGRVQEHTNFILASNRHNRYLQMQVTKATLHILQRTAEQKLQFRVVSEFKWRSSKAKGNGHRHQRAIILQMGSLNLPCCACASHYYGIQRIVVLPDRLYNNYQNCCIHSMIHTFIHSCNCLSLSM